ncbi:DUF4259 domain-containing protein [Micromonospora sp. 4G57]|uniref:DUF4259 domain-containing protein n=1 Tax=Micromonospora sicca TaxID=2202420 RepID=A0ABU5JHU6_9ACTN|nr:MULTISPECIES: DUF4259 domain-containing protein [unclassified Micromonospora]MDZ5442708.1 DUF4259 domain-containing protein [Micromonospora sp. 4G57]MDZ5492192.1 DUF4259 domain-containing protein [Micromonospora sp. 4G53]
MGTWAAGPFDNDTAADWCGELDDAAPERRPALVEQALRAVLDEPGYLDSDLAVEAVAAAAVIAAHLPGAAPVDSPYAPEFLAGGGRTDLPERFRPLAVQALDRVVADDSELAELWAEAGEPNEFVAELATLRAVLAA